MNITIDDNSPLIRYFSTSTNSSRAWTRSQRSDVSTDNCFGKTFTATTGEGDRMVLAFNGSAVWVYGSTWFNHGAFSASSDDRTPVIRNGSSSARVYQSLLYSIKGLDLSREHTIALTNLPSATNGYVPGLDFYLDIDYIVVEVPVSSNVFTTVVDDADVRMKYSGNWRSDGTSPGPTAHVSASRGDIATLAFNGSSIQAFGTLFPDHGNYSIAVDGVNKEILSGYWAERLSNASVFSISGLVDTQHELKIYNSGESSGSFFDLDRIVFNSTIDPNAPPGTPAVPSTPSSSSSPSPSSASSTTNTAVIAGAAVGALAIIVIAGLAGWLFWKRRGKGSKRNDTARIDLTGDEVKPFQPSQQGTNYILPPSTTSLNSTPTPPLLRIPPPPQSTTSSYPQSSVGDPFQSAMPSGSQYALPRPDLAATRSPLSDFGSTISSPHSAPSTAVITTASIAATRPAYPGDNKSVSATSMINSLRTRQLEEEGLRTSRLRSDEEEALFRSGSTSRQIVEEDTDHMPPPYI